MSAAKKAMINQLLDTDNEVVENALFVLNAEELNEEECLAISKVLNHKNKDTAYAALMVLIYQDSLSEEIRNQILPFLHEDNEDIQESVAKFVYDTYFESIFDDEDTPPITLAVAKEVKKFLETSNNSDAIFYLVAALSDYEKDNLEWSRLLSKFVDDSFSENVNRVTLTCLANRSGLSKDTIERAYYLFKNSDNPGINMMGANLLSQCEEAPERYRKEALDFFQFI